MNAPLRIGIAGLGTVGAGTLGLLAQHAELIANRCGRPLEVTAVTARDRRKNRPVDISKLHWFDDPLALAAEPGIDVVVELIGGADGPAKAVIERAIGAGKHVVTANKALLAHHGTALARSAEAAGVTIGYEASVAGGIPVIKALREGLAGNAVTSIYGILNGTCNFILTAMRESGRSFDAILEEAQRLGYAEADPSFDVDGWDAAHKLAILTALAFGTEVDLKSIEVEGIRRVTPLDIAYADELGLRVKLLGISRLVDGAVEQHVHPCLVDRRQPIAHVEGVFNAVVAQGDFVGNLLWEGRGAGAGPTASAVVADLIDIARGLYLPTFAIPADRLKKSRPLAAGRHVGCYYLRLMVVDRPGVIADIAAILRDENISLESVLQRARAPGEGVPVVLTTHETSGAAIRRAIARIDSLEAVVEAPVTLRIESL
ncbi:MAG: homoserine dehydrogenase [Kiloniellales bacterium]